MELEFSIYTTRDREKTTIAFSLITPSTIMICLMCPYAYYKDRFFFSPLFTNEIDCPLNEKNYY